MAFKDWLAGFELFNWPHLRVLELNGQASFHDNLSVGALNTFFARHPLIEEFRYHLAILPTFPTDIFSNLAILEARPWAIFAICNSMSLADSALHTVRCITMWDNTSIGLLASALEGRPSIRHIVHDRVVSAEQVQLLVDALPNLDTINGIQFTGDVRDLFVSSH